MPYFPKTAELIRRGFIELAESPNTPRAAKKALVEYVAKTFNELRSVPTKEPPVSSVVAWRSGSRAPSEPDVLAKVLFPDNSSRQKELIRTVNRERSSSATVTTQVDPLDLLEQNESVEIKIVQSPPFAGSVEGDGQGFFDEVLERYRGFASLGNLKLVKVPFSDVNREVLAGKVPAAVAGLLANVERLRYFVFTSLPISISVAGLLRSPSKGSRSIEQVRGDIRVPPGSQLAAVISSGEVGGSYLEKALGLKDPDRVHKVPRGDFSGYSDLLLAPDEDHSRVAFLDEYSAGQVILHRRKERSKARRTKTSSDIEFLFNPWDEQRSLPSFFLSIGADRRFPKWCQYLSESLELWAEADAPQLVSIYENLWTKLRKHLFDVLDSLGDKPHLNRRKADDWACRMLSLPDHARRPYVHHSRAWSEIIKKVAANVKAPGVTASG